MLEQHAARLAPGPRTELSLQPLLDHIAAELAEEYVRLMEAAAAWERDGARPDTHAAIPDEQ